MKDIRQIEEESDRVIRSVVILAFGAYFIYGAFHTHVFWMIDMANLLIHEGGHPIFGMFGNDTLQFLGGTLMQLLIPIWTIFHFIRQKAFTSAAVAGMWFGENFFGISIYMKDARAQVLPLVGGGIHDWAWLFGKWGILKYDQVIGNSVWWIGFIIIIESVIAGFLWINYEKQVRRIMK